MGAVLRWVRRHGLRVVALLVFALLALGIAPTSWRAAGVAALPRLSPILNLFGALAARRWIGWTVFLGVPLVVVAFLWGRVFCWRFCPMGFLAELAGRLNPRGRTWCRRVPALNKALALVIFVTAACGYPLFIWLDPLCIFNGFFAAWREPLTWASASIGTLFVVVLALAVAIPNVWCHRLCPLGGLQEAVMGLGRRLRRPGRADCDDGGPAELKEAKPPVLMGRATRRAMITAIPAAVAGFAARRGLGPKGTNALRPPTADAARINALCARCGNCMRACPEKLIGPDLGETGIDGVLSPVLRLRGAYGDEVPVARGFCAPDCTSCTQVCPTGALRPIDVLRKQETAIGVAEIDRTRCIAWSKNGKGEGNDCGVCSEFCLYRAITVEKHDGAMCPVVQPDRCRGCGACELGCPRGGDSKAGGPAIRVRPFRADEPVVALKPSEVGETLVVPDPEGGIRPPGAVRVKFDELCIRCGRCMQACPYQLIHASHGEMGREGLFTPVLHFRSKISNWDPDEDRYCFQDCVKCTQACPTGALRPITVEQKHAMPIGRAVVDRTKCLAWAKGEYCAVCDEYCPYKAIRLEERKGVNCPVVDPDKCRGCGACEGACPGDPVAIVVRPL